MGTRPLVDRMLVSQPMPHQGAMTFSEEFASSWKHKRIDVLADMFDDAAVLSFRSKGSWIDLPSRVEGKEAIGAAIGSKMLKIDCVRWFYLNDKLWFLDACSTVRLRSMQVLRDQVSGLYSVVAGSYEWRFGAPAVESVGKIEELSVDLQEVVSFKAVNFEWLDQLGPETESPWLDTDIAIEAFAGRAALKPIWAWLNTGKTLRGAAPSSSGAFIDPANKPSA